MNKEVVYVMRGFLLTVVVLALLVLGHFIASIPVRSQSPDLYSGTVASSTPKNSHGAQLFKNNCAACHSRTKNLTGPALSGVTGRIKDRKIIYQWVKNPAAMLRSGDPYFVNLKKQYGDVMMTPFPDLTHEEIDAILAYIGE